MRVDWQTLHDLGILEPGGSQASLFDWANRTRTGGGAQMLNERFRKPLVDAAEIRDTQAAVAFLAEHAQLFDTLLAGSSWKTLESQGVEALPGAIFHCFGAEVRGGEVIFDYQIREGVSTQRLGMHILQREGVLRQLRDLEKSVAKTKETVAHRGLPGNTLNRTEKS